MRYLLLLALAVGCGQPQPPVESVPEVDSAPGGGAVATSNPVLSVTLSPEVVASLDEEQQALIEQFSDEHYLELLAAARRFDAASAALLQGLSDAGDAGVPDEALVVEFISAHDGYQLAVVDGVLGLLRVVGPTGRAAFVSSGQPIHRSACNAVLQLLYTSHLGRFEALGDEAGMAGSEGYPELLLRDLTRGRALTETFASVVDECGKIDPAGERFVEELDALMVRAIVGLRTSMDERVELAIEACRATPADQRLELAVSTAFTDYAGITVQGAPVSTRLLTYQAGSTPPGGPGGPPRAGGAGAPPPPPPPGGGGRHAAAPSYQ